MNSYLPDAVTDSVLPLTGAINTVEPLGGLSGRTVVAVHGARGTVVAKGPATPVEVAVATDLAGVLASHGVRVPRTLAVVDLGEDRWVVTRHLAHALPRERWGADPAVLGVVRGLHSVPPGLVESLPGRYHPAWNLASTRAAAAPLGVDADGVDRLAHLAAHSASLFATDRAISGDPNPLNWRLDEDGVPVLVDWERLTVASPAIDLAILLPGLPDRTAAEGIIAAYGVSHFTADDVLLAKTWTVVELAATASVGSAAHEVVMRLRTPFATWIEEHWPS